MDIQSLPQEELQQIKHRLTTILLRYDIYMDGVYPQGDHNYMADALTLEVAKMLEEYRLLIERATQLLTDISHPFTNVERYDVSKWLEDAKRLMESQDGI